MVQDTKRRLINQLPAVHQTEVLKNFFGSTLDVVFQPGTSEQISGYVGQKPSYYDPDKDFYISEPTAARDAYQLEPGMVTVATDGTYTNSLCYDDLINYLNSQGANTVNHSRMFEGDYYSWAPPVDIDKLNNYLQYFWMGSLSDADYASSTITLRAPRSVYSYDGNVDATYNLPNANPDFGSDAEVPTVLVNGVKVQSNIIDGSAVIQTATLAVGDVIETIRYGDLTVVIDGRSSLLLFSLLTWTSTWAGPDGDTYRGDLPRQYAVGELAYVGDAFGSGIIYRCITAHTAGSVFDTQYWIPAVNATAASTGMRVQLLDGVGTTVTTARPYIFDGVGSAIVLSPDYTSATTNPGGSAPHYVVIDRRSQENSPWTRRNVWVHRSTLDWTGQDFSARQAQRPIIEFLPNIELYNYGFNRLPDVHAVLSNSMAQVIDNFGVNPWDDNVWDQEMVNLSRVNGQFFGRISNDGGADDTVIGSVVVDNGYILQPNDYLFVNQTNSPEPALNQLIYRVVSNPDTPLPSGARADVIELIVNGQPQRGDIFRVASVTDSVFSDQIEYWYNGEAWVQITSGADAPLFMLYDADKNSLADTNTFPGTDFTGSQLFSYVIGTGAADPILGFPITYDAYGQPIFQIDPIINRVTYNGGEIGGYYYQHFIDDDHFSNNWFAEALPSSQALVNGVYEIPLNLQANPGNLEVETISRSQWFDHFSAIMEAQVGFVGFPYSINNWRDTAKALGTGNSILQHRSPLLKTMLISSNINYDLPASIRYTDQEYTRFRNRFVQTLIDLRTQGVLLDSDDPTVWVEQILNQLRLNKTQDFPFAYSTVAGGAYFIPPTDAVLGVAQTATPAIVLDTTYDQPVLVIRGHDGSMTPAFGTYRPTQSFTVDASPSYVYDLGMMIGLYDLITVTMNSSTVDPSQYEITYDGKLTFRTVQTTGTPFQVSFADIRDTIFLALEQRIYDNIDASFKTEARPVFDLEKYISTRFVAADYSVDELNALLGPSFERWAQQNRFDYRVNNGYDAGNPFTWNFSTCLDRYNELLPGNWRGIYRLYFDTDRPNQAPWEMLGFLDKPIWWDGEYGVAPYTSGNTKLWDDMRDGNIRQGVRAGIDPRYVRSDLYSVLPVDEEGNLLDPVAAKIIDGIPNYQDAIASWEFGDQGPVENLWRNSTSFRYAYALAGFLAKPARYVEQGWDTINNIQDSTGQFIYKPTGNRPLDSEIYVHGEVGPDGVTRVQATGIQQWISDYMLSKGQDPSGFGTAIRGLEVILIHKMAAFTSLDNLKVMADNFGLVPSENISVQLYRSPSISEEVYSGVVVEWSGQGWRVLGYDIRNPYFNIIPPEVGGPKGYISLATSPEPVVNPWRRNTYYPTNTNVLYQNTIYSSLKGHTSGATFDSQFWQATNLMLPQAPRVTTYLNGTGEVQAVPYGTIFNTYQQVSDFLLGYERWLVSRGWVFDQQSDDGSTTLNWGLMVYEFLGWTQVQWQPGNFIALSPGSGGLKFSTSQGFVMDVLTSLNGAYGLLDRSGTPISRENAVINRIDADTTLQSKNADIYCARINISEIEHALFFNNTTIFNDLIYSPLFNLRQPRLRLIGNRSMNWTGRLDAPGFVLIDDQIKPNFVKAADDLLTMWDIEKADNATLTNYARHIIGYDSRDYLSSLVLSDVEQFEFYQGMIHQKGAPGAFDKLLRSDFIEQSRDLNFFEEWAFQISEFGAVQTRQRLAFLLGQSAVQRDPQLVMFKTGDPTNNGSDWIQLFDSTTNGLDPLWVDRPSDPLKFFPQRDTFAPNEDTDLPVSGYVRLTEATYTSYDMTGVLALYDVANNATLQTAETVWVHSTPSVQDVYDQFNSQWYLFGTKTGSFWDGTTDTVSQDPSYVVVNNQGDTVFRSKPYEAPYIGSNSQFTPVAGHTYTTSFAVRKITAETNGVTPYLRPAFDAFTSDGTLSGGLGTKTGFGYNSSNDLIDTTNWKLGQWYTVQVQWVAPMSPTYADARARLRVNRTTPTDDSSTVFSNAVFEVKSQTFTLQTNMFWDLFRVYELSEDGAPNTIAKIQTNAEDNTITTTRIFMTNAHGLEQTDIGSVIVIDGQTQTQPQLQGMQTISSVTDDYFEIFVTGEDGFDFTANATAGPAVRILRTQRFANLSAFNAFKADRPGQIAGDLAYVDGAPWRVYKLSTITEQQDDYDQTDGVFVTPPTLVKFWNVYRSQPMRMDAQRLYSSAIYDLKTKITPTDLQPEPLSLNGLDVLAPITGQIIGQAEKEITYSLAYDPAIYNFRDYGNAIGGYAATYQQSVNTVYEPGPWGLAQVGQVWWDLSTVRFLETETDNVSFGYTEETRFNAEADYRSAYWGQIAPGTSVDVYEWVRSAVSPSDYMANVSTDTTDTYVGEVYNSDAPQWVETQEFDPTQGAISTFYYFWVKGLDATPNIPSRSMSVTGVAELIQSPTTEDVAWIAPVLPNALLVGGSAPFLDDSFETQAANAVADSGTVLQVDVNDPYEGVQHDQWILMRPNDELSLPPDWLWDKLTESLVGFDDDKSPSPAIVTPPQPVPPVNQPPVWQTPLGGSISPYQLLNTVSSSFKPSVSGVCYEGDNFVAQVQAIDPEGEDIAYLLVGGSLPLGLTLEPNTGIITGMASLDHLGGGELMGDYTWTFSLQAFDGAVLSPVQQFNITVKHINQPPVWLTASGQIVSMSEGQTASALSLSAYDPQYTTITGANAALIYTVASGALPSGLTLNPNGSITGTLPNELVPKAGSSFSFTAAVDSTEPDTTPVQRTFSIFVANVNKPPVWQTGPNLGTFPERTPMSMQLTATDIDLDTLTYSVVGGAVPSGLSLSSTGVLSGTPSEVTTDTAFSFTAQVTDGQYNVDQTFTGVIQNVNRAPVWNTGPGTIFDNFENSPVNITVTATDPDGQSVSYFVASGSFPPGLSLNGANGNITGTLPLVGADTTYPFAIGASDGSLSTTQNFTIIVRNIPDQAPIWNTTSGSVGSDYTNRGFSFQLSAFDPDNGPNPMIYYAVGGMPGSLSVSSSGLISGNLPGSAGTYGFTVAINDGAIEVQRGFSVTVNGVPSGSQQFTSDADWQVPGGVTLLNFDWVLAGGGGGGRGVESGNGGGGGGGGSGGWYQNVGLNVNGGDVIHVSIGAAGAGGVDGQSGGTTTVYLNGTAVIQVDGGGGGAGSPQSGGTYFTSAGGVGGAPNGNPGQTGQPGTGDRASGVGAAGGSSPLGNAGAGGGIGQNGGNADGYGAGGGGGGFHDRTNPLQWFGGNGSQGFVQLSY